MAKLNICIYMYGERDCTCIKCLQRLIPIYEEKWAILCIMMKKIQNVEIFKILYFNRWIVWFKGCWRLVVAKSCVSFVVEVKKCWDENLDLFSLFNNSCSHKVEVEVGWKCGRLTKSYHLQISRSMPPERILHRSLLQSNQKQCRYATSSILVTKKLPN